MNISIKGISKPKFCYWIDENKQFHECTFRDRDGLCKLQDLDAVTTKQLFESCPLIDGNKVRIKEME